MKFTKTWAARLAALLVIASLTISLAYAGQTITGNVSFSASFGETLSSGLINSETFSQAISQTDSYTTSGTGAGQLNLFYATQLTLAANTPQTIDLTTLTDPANKTANFARVREFIVQEVDKTAGYDVKIYSPSTTGWPIIPPTASPLYCRQGSILRISDKNSTGSGVGNVVSGTASQITFDPGTHPLVVNVMILGCDAQ